MKYEGMKSNEIYSELIDGVNVLLNRKAHEKSEMESAGKNTGAVYASVLNEIGTLRRISNEFMLFSR